MMFKIATVALKWSPQDFWKSTPRELFFAIECAEEQAAAVRAHQDNR